MLWKGLARMLSVWLESLLHRSWLKLRIWLNIIWGSKFGCRWEVRASLSRLGSGRDRNIVLWLPGTIIEFTRIEREILWCFEVHTSGQFFFVGGGRFSFDILTKLIIYSLFSTKPTPPLELSFRAYQIIPPHPITANLPLLCNSIPRNNSSRNLNSIRKLQIHKLRIWFGLTRTRSYPTLSHRSPRRFPAVPLSPPSHMISWLQGPIPRSSF